jgi:hypothetical protein
MSAQINMRYQYPVYPRRILRNIRCKTTTSIIHQQLEKFFARHVSYDYSESSYVYIVKRIQTASPQDYMEITYTQYSCIYDSPTKELAIIKPNKIIRITDNFSANDNKRYQYSVQQ